MMPPVRLSLLLAFLLPTLSAAQTITRQELPSGLTVIAAEWTNTHAVDVRVLVRAGPAYEDDLLGSGASRLLERLVQVAARDPERAATVLRLGQALRSEVGVGYSSYALETTDRNHRQALELLASLLAEPPLDEEDFELVRDQQMRALAKRDKDWRARQHELLHDTIYARHPARLPIDGRAEDLARLDLEGLAAYHRRRYTAANTVVVVSGNIHPQQVGDAVAEAFADFPRGHRAEPPLSRLPVQYAARTRRLPFPSLADDRRAYAWRTTSLADPDRLALDLVAIMLTAPGLIDLPKSTRNLCSDFTAEHHQFPERPGYFAIRYATGAKLNVEAWQKVHEALDELRKDGPDPAHLAAAKRQWRQRHLLNTMDVTYQTRELGLWELEVIDPDYRLKQLAAVPELTPNDIRRVVDRHLHPLGRNRSIVILKPEAATTNGTKRTPVSDAPPEIVPFDNGAHLLKRQMPALGLTVLRVSIGGGVSAETNETLGASRVLAGLLAMGPEAPEAENGRKRARQFQDRLIATGMDFDAYATRHSIELTLICFPDDVEEALNILVDTLKRPALPESAFRQLIQDAVHDIGIRNQNATWHETLVDRMSQTLFQDHYASKPLRGTRESLSGLDPSAIRDLHRRLCVGSNIVFSAYGRFDNDRIGNVLAAILGSDEALPVGEKVPITGEPWPEELSLRSIKLENGDKAAGLGVFFRAPALEDLEREGPAMDLLTAMLTGAEGRCGRIPITIDKTLTIRTHHRFYRGRGIWGVLVDAPTDRIDPIRQAILEQIDTLLVELRQAVADGAPDTLLQDIADARSLCINRFLLCEEDQRSTTEAHAHQLLLDLPIETYLDYPQRLEKVKLEDLATVADRYLANDILRVQLLPPTKNDGDDGDTPSP